MIFFNKEEVYFGYSMEDFSKVRSILNREGIKYTHKIIDPSGQWFGPGTSRGNFGSFGMNKNYEKQYVVSVKIKDAENAKFFVHSVLHS
ncbi:hypothetical protein [Bacillus sp. S/N-304-OC-R1]|uniref:hypothetical protein n=1 Tax=Bacillus sp. S/N-304-OC-R1 TaxID=2758034 RepID=UPI001C8EE8F5|nr:hypothetical protein [Bacillus sp. S/N-304-OC-R1]MBY0121569.1 hypothetical protein [Bacillus sp. S/N-304-OC-R1]